MDNRHHLVMDSQVTLADVGYGEWNAAQQMVGGLRGEHPRTMGADKGYDTKKFVHFMRWLDVIPHVAQNINREEDRPWLDQAGGRLTTRQTPRTRHCGWCLLATGDRLRYGLPGQHSQSQGSCGTNSATGASCHTLGPGEIIINY